MPVVVHVKVVDGFFVQFIDGVDVPVLMQRRQYWIVREMGYVRVVFGALYVESQCPLAVVQNCCSPWRFHRCSSWVGGVMPVVVQIC